MRAPVHFAANVTFGHANRPFRPFSPLWQPGTGGTSIALRDAMTAHTPKPRSLPRVTWLEVGERAYYLIARCECCALVVERQLDDVDGDEMVLDSIGADLLMNAGCDHVESGVGSGMRPALRR